jgi:4-amino-4-deoxy-L-arabinose transferase-like glycosyltransferase
MPARLAHILFITFTCIVVYWLFLGVPGFGSSEGHRVGPAWEMLESHDWIHLKLFGLTYLRKPPGMPWAIAISSSILGQTEFAARAVSALASTLMALVAYWFTNRWLGSPWGLAAGLAQALSPLFLTIGRTAEIDPLNAFATQLFAFALISLLTSTRVPSAQCLLPKSSLLLFLGLTVAGLVKGPASLPVFLGIAAAACIQSRSFQSLKNRALWVPTFAAAILLAAFALWFSRANADPQAVTQDFSEFTWSVSRLTGTALLLPASFVAAVPTSAAIVVLLFHWREPRERRDPHFPLAALLALAWAISILVLMLTGSSNPRYAMPAGVLLAPLTAFAIRACWLARSTSLLARLAILGHPLVPYAILLVAAAFWIRFDIRRPRHQEGREAGAAIAASLPDGAVVWANDLVEARPDALIYARAAARRNGRSLLPRWKKDAIRAAELPPAPVDRPLFLLLRNDSESAEASRYRPLIQKHDLVPVASGEIAKYQWTIFGVTPLPSP